ncbi:MAG: hypothetical protein F8N37_02125 [Telmatospirillum sp.]|nr:hypothetical protein [Telmatospirillum sp.]
MKLDFLFGRLGPARPDADGPDADRPETANPLAGRQRGTSTFGFRRPSRGRPLALPPPTFDTSVRNMSPRQLADWAHEKYLLGQLSWQDYLVAGFHVELHPDYNATIGALTGEVATPDRPRDMVREWEERLAFFSRHNTPDDPLVRRVSKILSLLCGQDPAGRGR